MKKKYRVQAGACTPKGEIKGLLNSLFYSRIANDKKTNFVYFYTAGSGLTVTR
jgi:hypothetical protein